MFSFKMFFKCVFLPVGPGFYVEYTEYFFYKQPHSRVEPRVDIKMFKVFLESRLKVAWFFKKCKENKPNYSTFLIWGSKIAENLWIWGPLVAEHSHERCFLDKYVCRSYFRILRERTNGNYPTNLRIAVFCLFDNLNYISECDMQAKSWNPTRKTSHSTNTEDTNELILKSIRAKIY